MPPDAAPDWEDPRRVMRRHGLAPKKRFSQNFLVARHAVDRIVDALGPSVGERVTELGPGLGTLTAALLRAGARVRAVEADADMIAVLEAELGGVPGFSVEPGDAATVSLDTAKVVGNLPYAVTGAILKNLVAQRATVRRAVVMVQREVQARLTAPPGSKTYGALSVFTQASFEISPVIRVPPGAFHPPPKVESAVVRLDVLATPRADERPAFREIVKAAFGQRRKTLRNALKPLGPAAVDAIEAAGVDPRARAETLSVEQLDAIARAFEGR